MTPITTNRVCSAMADLDHDWAIVAEFPARAGQECVSGWHWHLPPSQVGFFLLARDDDRTVVTVQKRVGNFRFVLYAKRRAPMALRVA